MANKEFIAKNGLIAIDTILVSNTTATFVSANSTKANINVATDVVSVNTGAVMATTINATSTFFGNTTANVFANSTLIKVANSAGSANINPAGFVAGIVTANLTHVAVGSNVILSSADVQIGNSTVNSAFTATSIKRNNVEAAYSNVYILGSGLANVSANIAANVTISVPSAAISDIRSSGNDYAISVDNLWNSLAFVSLTDAATIAWDMSTGINFNVTIAGNRTLGAPTNAKVGQSGYLIVRQDATGGRTLAYNAVYFFKDGGAAPTLGAGATVYNAFSYFVYTSSFIILSPAMNLA